MRPSNRSAWRGWAPPFRCPPRGWLPRNRHPRGNWPSNASTITPLALPGVGNQGPFPAIRGHLPHMVHDPADGRADDHQLGIRDPLVQVDAGVGNGADTPGDPQCLAPPDANDLSARFR